MNKAQILKSNSKQLAQHFISKETVTLYPLQVCQYVIQNAEHPERWKIERYENGYFVTLNNQPMWYNIWAHLPLK